MSSVKKNLSWEEIEENIIEWTTLFRRNWHIYVEMVLGIELRPFQKVMIYLMGISDFFFAICSRGLSKSFIAGLGAICAFNLKPYSEVVITSSTIPQANKLVEKKIRDELIKKLSPYLRDMYERGYIEINRADDGYTVRNKLNHSTITVLPCMDSARGERATLLIYEECRLLKKTIIDSVFEKMAHPRQAEYLTNPIYGSDDRWLEECKSIYITSARYKFEWFFKTFKDAVTSYYNDKKSNAYVFAGDIFMAITNGLKTWGDYRKAKKTSGEADFRMEDLNEMVGEGEDAFFNLKSFKLNQELMKNWQPPTTQDLYTGTDLGNPKKKEKEVRLVITDYAFANTTKRGQENDNTIIFCMSLHWKGRHFERHVDYIEGHAGGDSLGAVDRAREIFWDYDADFYCPD